MLQIFDRKVVQADRLVFISTAADCLDERLFSEIIAVEALFDTLSVVANFGQTLLK